MNKAARKSDSPPQVDLTRLTRGGRGPGPIVRDLSYGSVERDAGVPLWRAFGTGRAWLVSTLLKLLACLVVAVAIILGPPAFECRQRAETGFFIGDTLPRCIGEATNQRLRSLENWTNTLVRGSGA